MSYKSIATILHEPAQDRAAFEVAIAFARKAGAHLHVLCIGVDDTDPGFYYAGVQALAVQQNFEISQGIANKLEACARDRLAAEDIAWDVQNVTTLPGGLDVFISDTMRFYDLIVLPTPYQDTAGRADTMIFEASVLGASRPVLMVPPACSDKINFENVMIAWDDGVQAMAACRAGLPLIAAARETEITIVDPPVHGHERSDRGGRLAAYIARFGARADISILARAEPSIGAQLLTRAKERGVDLVVMGAYGRSPLREALLGGATRDMLRLTDIPILMAH
ncbi:universal stress protein [Yoonia sp. MH D7]